MRRRHRMAIGIVAVGLLVSGCYGPFMLTRKLHTWNGQVSDNRWVVEGVFLVCVWAPVYGIAGLVDAIVLNSVEFWTGRNPMESADATKSRRIVHRDAEALLTRRMSPAGEQFLIEQFRRGEPVGSVRIERRGDVTVALSADDELLFSARTLQDGSVSISDADGRTIAVYPADHLDHLAKALKN